MKEFYCNVCKGIYYGETNNHVSNRHPQKESFKWVKQV